jgi:3-oxoacyl-[acyl-carrier protein] reductase
MTQYGLNGQVAVITGGGGGIGRRAALRLGASGAKICITDIDEEVVGAARSFLMENGIESVGLGADVTNRDHARAVIGRVLEAYGRVDILVNTAGIYHDCLFADMSDDEWERTMDVNLKGVYAFCKEAIDPMAERGYGRIINLTSQAGINGSVMHAHYAASKAAIIGLSCSLAKELASFGIHVNCVAPGIIETSMTAGYDEEQVRRFLSLIPLGRFGLPDEVAGVIAFLASEDANYMTGQTVNVTGGWLMHS